MKKSTWLFIKLFTIQFIYIPLFYFSLVPNPYVWGNYFF